MPERTPSRKAGRKPSPNKMKAVTVRLPPDLYDWAEKARGTRKMADFLRDCIAYAQKSPAAVGK